MYIHLSWNVPIKSLYCKPYCCTSGKYWMQLYWHFSPSILAPSCLCNCDYDFSYDVQQLWVHCEYNHVFNHEYVLDFLVTCTVSINTRELPRKKEETWVLFIVHYSQLFTICITLCYMPSVYLSIYISVSWLLQWQKIVLLY